MLLLSSGEGEQEEVRIYITFTQETELATGADCRADECRNLPKVWRKNCRRDRGHSPFEVDFSRLPDTEKCLPHAMRGHVRILVFGSLS